MKSDLRSIVTQALEQAIKQGKIKNTKEVILERPKKEGFGDYSTNIAMLLSGVEGRPARKIAEDLLPGITAHPSVVKCEIAGPGFINIFLDKSYWHGVLKEIIEKRDSFGELTIGKGKKVQVEFVSANPTGPLHIGHGRGAAVGDALSNVLTAAGFEVQKEYYINDVGRQVFILGESVRLWYLKLLGKDVEFPEEFYKGEYVKDIAKEFLTKHGEKYQTVFSGECLQEFVEFSMNSILSWIKKDLNDFGVKFDSWFSEKTLVPERVEKTNAALKEKGFIYEDEGAVFFRTTDFGDDKDRVLIKADKSSTYFSSDVAYHLDKAGRGFSTLVDVWGADHHGYEARVRSVFKAFGFDDAMLKIIFIQLVALLRNGVPVAMGKREGEFVTLRQVMDEVGRDATRFFFLMRKSDAHLDFDLELAKKQAPENPVFYVQYCFARISSITGFARQSGIAIPDEPDLNVLKRLEEKDEFDLIRKLSAFEEVVEKSALEMEPHRITFFAQELAGLFHPYYNRSRVVTDDKELTLARLYLCKAVGTVIRKSLGLLGVSAPEKM